MKKSPPAESVQRQQEKDLLASYVLTPQGPSITIEEHFAGKRNALRACRLLEVEVEGKRRSFHGMAVDISRSGFLLRISDPEFAEPEEMDQLMPYTARVWFHFEGGLQITFKEADLSVTADVVRVTGYSGRNAHIILIGCRFRRKLTVRECEALDVPDEDDPPARG